MTNSSISFKSWFPKCLTHDPISGFGEPFNRSQQTIVDDFYPILKKRTISFYLNRNFAILFLQSSDRPLLGLDPQFGKL